MLASDKVVLSFHLVQTLAFWQFHAAQIYNDVAGLLEGQPHVVLNGATTATLGRLDLPQETLVPDVRSMHVAGGYELYVLTSPRQDRGHVKLMWLHQRVLWYRNVSDLVFPFPHYIILSPLR